MHTRTPANTVVAKTMQLSQLVFVIAALAPLVTADAYCYYNTANSDDACCGSPDSPCAPYRNGLELVQSASSCPPNTPGC